MAVSSLSRNPVRQALASSPPRRPGNQLRGVMRLVPAQRGYAACLRWLLMQLNSVYSPRRCGRRTKGSSDGSNSFSSWKDKFTFLEKYL